MDYAPESAFGSGPASGPKSRHARAAGDRRRPCQWSPVALPKCLLALAVAAPKVASRHIRPSPLSPMLSAPEQGVVLALLDLTGAPPATSAMTGVLLMLMRGRMPSAARRGDQGS